MSTTNENPKRERGAGEPDRPERGCASGETKRAMAGMMGHCGCGPEMMAKMADLMGGGGPSKPAEATDER